MIATALTLVPATAIGDDPGQTTGSTYPLPPPPAKGSAQKLPVSKGNAEQPWPPVPEGGNLFVHFGEEHWNDDDGLRILPTVIADSARYEPDLVTMSGDKANNGTIAQLQGWKGLMEAYDREGIPYFAGVGNHDREARSSSLPGLDPMGSLAPYMQVFADRPYPFGDAPPLDDPLFSPATRPASDPAGASSHYAFEYGEVRWIFIDNSCFSIVNCDPFQSPPFPDADGNLGQYDFLAGEAAIASAEGDLAFVVMHMPTQDNRPGHTQPTPFPHTMGEGTSPDNEQFEQAASAAGVDAVLTGHIKGQWQYTAGNTAYYTDGGAGGEVYVDEDEEDVGVDSGYWHGYRLLGVDDGQITTDTVPVFSAAGITVSGPASVAKGQSAEFSAVAAQPTEVGPRVDALELREPDPSVSNAAWLPTPAHIWTTGNPLVLRPVAAANDDPRRDPRTQTTSGAFEGLCPGSADIKVTSGWESESVGVTVPSDPGRIVRSIRAGAASLRPGHPVRVASVRLAQPAQVEVQVLRHGKKVRTLTDLCHQSSKRLKTAWNGRADGKRVKPGRYKVRVIVRSDRKPVKRAFAVQVRG